MKHRDIVNNKPAVTQSASELNSSSRSKKKVKEFAVNVPDDSQDTEDDISSLATEEIADIQPEEVDSWSISISYDSSRNQRPACVSPLNLEELTGEQPSKPTNKLKESQVEQETNFRKRENKPKLNKCPRVIQCGAQPYYINTQVNKSCSSHSDHTDTQSSDSSVKLCDIREKENVSKHHTHSRVIQCGTRPKYINTQVAKPQTSVYNTQTVSWSTTGSTKLNDVNLSSPAEQNSKVYNPLIHYEGYRSQDATPSKVITLNEAIYRPEKDCTSSIPSKSDTEGSMHGIPIKSPAEEGEKLSNPWNLSGKRNENISFKPECDNFPSKALAGNSTIPPKLPTLHRDTISSKNHGLSMDVFIVDKISAKLNNAPLKAEEPLQKSQKDQKSRSNVRKSPSHWQGKDEPGISRSDSSQEACRCMPWKKTSPNKEKKQGKYAKMENADGIMSTFKDNGHEKESVLDYKEKEAISKEFEKIIISDTDICRNVMKHKSTTYPKSPDNASERPSDSSLTGVGVDMKDVLGNIHDQNMCTDETQSKSSESVSESESYTIDSSLDNIYKLQFFEKNKDYRIEINGKRKMNVDLHVPTQEHSKHFDGLGYDIQKEVVLRDKNVIWTGPFNNKKAEISDLDKSDDLDTVDNQEGRCCCQVSDGSKTSFHDIQEQSSTCCCCCCSSSFTTSSQERECCQILHSTMHDSGIHTISAQHPKNSCPCNSCTKRIPPELVEYKNLTADKPFYYLYTYMHQRHTHCTSVPINHSSVIPPLEQLFNFCPFYTPGQQMNKGRFNIWLYNASKAYCELEAHRLKRQTRLPSHISLFSEVLSMGEFYENFNDAHDFTFEQQYAPSHIQAAVTVFHRLGNSLPKPLSLDMDFHQFAFKDVHLHGHIHTDQCRNSCLCFRRILHDKHKNMAPEARQIRTARPYLDIADVAEELNKLKGLGYISVKEKSEFEECPGTPRNENLEKSPSKVVYLSKELTELYLGSHIVCTDDSTNNKKSLRKQISQIFGQFFGCCILPKNQD